ncbi:MAG: hypothetical protein QM749_02300 [Aquabacterium sp.]
MSSDQNNVMRVSVSKRAMGWAAVSAIALALTGCAGYTRRVDVAEVPTMADAYLYGRFHIEAPSAWLTLDGHQSMGFVIECDDHRAYVLRFDRENPVLAIKVRPATCAWTEIVYTDADGTVRSRQPAPPQAFKAVVLQGGYSYYMGDFHAEVTNTVSRGMAHTEWHIKAVRENYEITTQDMQEAYPNLRALPSENRMLTSKEPPHGLPKPKGVDGSIALADQARGTGLTWR